MREWLVCLPGCKAILSHGRHGLTSLLVGLMDSFDLIIREKNGVHYGRFRVSC